MRRNFILLAALDILSMVAPSHTAIYFPQITSSELIRPYCNATSISEAFLHDVIPFQSCAPTKLTQDAIYCKATTISENAKNMSCPGAATTKSSLDIARVLIFVLDGVRLLTSLFLWFAIVSFFYKVFVVVHQWAKWTGGLLTNNDIEWNILATLWKFRKKPQMEHLIKAGGLISYRHESSDTSLNIYLLKEAFEELERHPRILEEPNFYDFATAFMLDPVPRAAFMKIPDDRKFDWINKRYRDDILIGWSWRRMKY